MSNDVTRQGSIPSAMGWMVGLSAALFWLPGGSLIAGYVGGRKAGSPGRAIVAAILPGAALGIFMFLVGAILQWIPILGQVFGFVAGLGSWMLSFMNIIPLLIGAVIGGFMERSANS